MMYKHLNSFESNIFIELILEKVTEVPGGGSHIDMVYVYVPAFWGTFSRNLV